MNISIAIAVHDKGDPHSNTGDIIAIKPGGWQWGTEEVRRFLIMELDVANIITDIARCQKLLVPRLDSGARWYPPDNADGTPATYTVVAKRRYHFLQSRLDTIAANNGITLDWNRIRDITDAYQPLRNIAVSPIANLRDKIGGVLITLQTLREIRDA